jgi:hypothetical protein
MRVPSQKVMAWQPSPSRAKLHQASHSFQTSLSKHASWQRKAKEGKIKNFPSPKYVTSDEDTLSSNNYASSNDDEKP